MSEDSPAGLVAAALVINDQRHFLIQDLNVIGRSENAFITIRDQRISRKHCVIEKSSDYTFTIRDLSAKGTFLNGKKMVKNKVYELQHRNKISLAILDDQFTYTFVLNKKFQANSEKSEELSSRLKEKMLNFDNTYSENINKLNSKLTKMETEKSELKELMNCRIEEQENVFEAERQSLSSRLSATNEQKEEAERKLREMEANCESEKKKLMKEVETKISDITKKEEELQQLKHEMEIRYQEERGELEERCKAEIKELKEKLAVFEVEQERLQDETREAEQKLAETQRCLMESEIEQFRLGQEKDEVELKLESKIIDLTKESTSKDEVVKDLEERLREKERAEEKLKKEIEVLEEELQCSICAELFVEPTVLNCGHMFCKTCIEEWKRKKKVCPMCRAKIVTSVRIFTVDTIIEKNVALLSNEAKARREALIVQRQEAQTPRGRKRKHNHHRAGPHQVTIMGRIAEPPPLVAIPRNILLPMLRMNEEAGENSMILEQEDPFTWNVDRRPSLMAPHPPRPAWMVPPVTVAAIDLTNIPPASTPTLAIREPIDLTHLTPAPDRPSTSTAHVSTTIDLTSP